MSAKSRLTHGVLLLLLTALLICVVATAARAWGIIPHHPNLSPGKAM
jgi:hypothetical protein